jgi:chemotaxis signal transduction protein
MPSGYADEWAERLRQPQEAAERRTGSILIFRIAELTLGLQATYVKAIVEPRAICPLPHRRNTAFLGLIAFSGDIIPCCSLAHLLGLADNTEGTQRRTLILQDAAEMQWAIPIGAALTMAIETDRKPLNTKEKADTLPAGWQLKTLTGEDKGALVLNPEMLFSSLVRAAG